MYEDSPSPDSADEAGAPRLHDTSSTNLQHIFFLLRTCRAGHVRFNQANEFNGSLLGARPGMATERVQALAQNWHRRLALKDVSFSVRDYRQIATTEGDLLYLDPPYETGEGRHYSGKIDFGELFGWLRKQQGERHPPVSVLTQQLLKCWSGESCRPDGPPDADVNEERRLDSPVGFDGIDGINKIGRVIASAVVAPGEEGRRHGIGTSVPHHVTPDSPHLARVSLPHLIGYPRPGDQDLWLFLPDKQGSLVVNLPE